MQVCTEGGSPTRNVATLAERRTLERVGRLVDTAANLGHPVEATLQDPLDAPLKRRPGNGTRAARPPQLNLDDAGLDVGRHEGQIAAVGLDRRTHQLEQAVQVLFTLGALFIAQQFRRHPPILPCPEQNRSAATPTGTRQARIAASPVARQPGSGTMQPVLSASGFRA